MVQEMTTGSIGYNPICVALDLKDRTQIEALAESLEDHVGMFKVGLTAFSACGPELVAELTHRLDVFLDLKLHDIPVQVSGAVGALEKLGARFLTVHATGGNAMMTAAAEAADDMEILAVTVLTSLDQGDLDELGFTGTSSEQVERLAEQAISAGVDGLVCSPMEVAVLRERFGPSGESGPTLMVPGIRPEGSDHGDQRRVMTPREAIAAGADHIVVGRPITAAADPVAAARQILAEVSS